MDRKLGYQRLSKLLFRIDHLEISYDSDTRRNFIEFYIQQKLILLWYSKPDTGVQMKRGGVGFHNLSKMQLPFQLQFQMLIWLKNRSGHSCKFQLMRQLLSQLYFHRFLSYLFAEFLFCKCSWELQLLTLKK